MSKDRHPVVINEVSENDEGYQRGARFRLNTLYNDQFYFKTIQGAQEFMTLHGCVQINEDLMLDLQKKSPDSALE